MRKENEPITPFISKVRALLHRGVSSILVMGGSGDYFGVSDTVVRMDCYKMKDVTAEAHAIDQRFRGASEPLETDAAYGSIPSRTPVTVYPGSLSGKILSLQDSSLSSYQELQVATDLNACVPHHIPLIPD